MPDEPVPPVPPSPDDPHRRRFFRLFAGDVAASVGSMIGVAQSLQAESANAARELLGVAAPVVAAPDEPPAAVVLTQGPYLANTAGYRAPFRFEDEAVFAWDQRQLPDILQEIQILGASDGVNAMNEGQVIGAAVQAQMAAATLSLIAARAHDSRPFARRATIRGAANAFRLNRPASAQVVLAMDRLTAIVDEAELDIDGKVLADAIRREAEEIIVEATEDHGKIAEFAPEALPGGPDATLHVLTAGSTGAMGSGVFGTALGVITSRFHAGQPIHALVAESRPLLAGARVACWELGQAGVPHAVVTDAAAPGCIAAGEVEVVLVTADRIAANGDLAAPIGTYALALAAKAAGVPLVVCVATTAIDLSVADADDLTLEDARPGQVLNIRGMRIAHEGIAIRNPVTDVVTADLVTAIVTDEGVLRAPFGASIAAAAERASERRMAARGFRALVVQRAKAAEEAAAAAAAASRDATAQAPDPASAPALDPAPRPAFHLEGEAADTASADTSSTVAPAADLPPMAPPESPPDFDEDAS